MTVNYALGGTAGNGVDYATLSGTVTLAANATTATITVTPIDDSIAESSETVVASLAAGAGYTLGSPNSATVTIADNETPLVSITATDSVASEPGSDTGQFTVSRLGSTANRITVNLTRSGTATNGTDYATLAATVRINAGASSATITVTPIDDTLVEGNETVALTLAAGTGYTVGSPNNATVTIADNDTDGLPTVSIVATDATASEPGADTGLFTVTRTGSTAGSLAVNYAMSGSATKGADYTDPGGAVTIAAGQASATITIAPLNDAIVESTETVVAQISANPNYNISGSASSATINLLDDDNPGVTINGAQTYQVIDGFGVNANHRSWNGTELQPVLDALIDQAGMTLFRVVFDNTDWEATNDNSDPAVMNWTYYNGVYGSSRFTPLWDMVAYLNGRGITDGVFFNFMGPGPAWMGGSSLTAGQEAEWAETITSLLAYARNTKGLQFHLVAPNNEPDISNEGITMGAAQYRTALNQLAQRLDANGLGDLRFVAPDRAGGGTGYFPELLADPVVMAKLPHFGVHSYSGGGGGSGGVLDTIHASAYPDRNFWMTEFNVWCSTCDSGVRGTYDWNYTRGTADYLLNHLANGASAGIIWEGYDSFYAHPPSTWSFWGLLSVDNENVTPKTYTPRKNFYTVAQISKFVRPGARRIGVGGTTAPFAPLLAFYHAGLGQVTVVGINTSGSAAQLRGTLASLPTVASLDLTYTSSAANLASGGSVPVSNGAFVATIPADSVFTLTGFTGVTAALTSPANNARYNAPAAISLAATASTPTGSIVKVEFYQGATKLGEDTSAPYEFVWTDVPMGDYALTARATDSSGNTGTSAAVNVAVVGPLAQISVTPASATVAVNGTQQFSATGADALGHALAPQPALTWSVTGGGTISAAGLFTAGSAAGGPFEVRASSGGVSGAATVTVAAVGGGTIGNTGEGTFTDNIWDNGAWINATRFQAGSNMVVATMSAKVVALTGHYKYAIYSDNAGSPSQLLRASTEVTNPPANGWYQAPLTSPLTLTKDAFYWLAVWSDSPAARVYAQNGGTLRWGRYNYGAWPDPIAPSGGGSFTYSIYARGD